jgi:hypothetical protein
MPPHYYTGPVSDQFDGVRFFDPHVDLQEAGVICCAGSSIVAGVVHGRSGRFGLRRLTLTVPRHVSKARLGGFPMLATPAF